MATLITAECMNCGRCVPVCPGRGITPGSEGFFVIDSSLCTECVGFYSRQQCAYVCPVECCIPDPNHVESEAALFARAKRLSPDRVDSLGRSLPKPVLGPGTSHFTHRTLWTTLRHVGRRVAEQLSRLRGAHMGQVSHAPSAASAGCCRERDPDSR